MQTKMEGEDNNANLVKTKQKPSEGGSDGLLNSFKEFLKARSSVSKEWNEAVIGILCVPWSSVHSCLHCRTHRFNLLYNL